MYLHRPNDVNCVLGFGRTLILSVNRLVAYFYKHKQNWQLLHVVLVIMIKSLNIVNAKRHV